MIKCYETVSCYYKVDFSNRKYDVIYKFNMDIYTDCILPAECDMDFFTKDFYKEITEKQYNYMLEI